jgi:hypothetical protein
MKQECSPLNCDVGVKQLIKNHAVNKETSVMVTEQSKACTVFARSEAGSMGSNPSQDMDVWCVCVCPHVRALFLCLSTGRDLAMS